MKITKEKLLKARPEDVKRLGLFMGWNEVDFTFTYDELLDWISWQCSIKYK